MLLEICASLEQRRARVIPQGASSRRSKPAPAFWKTKSPGTARLFYASFFDFDLQKQLVEGDKFTLGADAIRVILVRLLATEA